jgi:hypothetical protein
LKICFLGMFLSFHNWNYPAGFRVSNGGAGPVRTKPNDYLAIRDRTQSAGLASDIVPDLGRAYDDCPPGGCIGFGRGVYWHNGTDWAGISFHQGVSFPGVISGQVHGEPPGVRMPDPVQDISSLFVGVRETLPPDIGADDIAQGGGVQVFPRSGQIPCHIVTPQGPSGQGGN